MQSLHTHMFSSCGVHFVSAASVRLSLAEASVKVNSTESESSITERTRRRHKAPGVDTLACVVDGCIVKSNYTCTQKIRGGTVLRKKNHRMQKNFYTHHPW